MFLVPIERTGRAGRIACSAALHAVAAAALFLPNREIKVRESLPGVSLGTRMELTYLPGGESASAPNRRNSLASQAPAPPLRHEKTPIVQESPAAPAAASNSSQRSAKTSSAPSSGVVGSASNDALGTDDIQIALTAYSPSPVPDLSLLPRGKQGDVIIDITIDPSGKVADLQILQTLGYGVDGRVADTVRTWIFHPATRDGVPVASVQELHFHYGPA